MHHGLFKAAQADADKHGFKYAILFTKQKFGVDYLVTIERELFNKMLTIPEVQKLLQK